MRTLWESLRKPFTFQNVNHSYHHQWSIGVPSLFIDTIESIISLNTFSKHSWNIARRATFDIKRLSTKMFSLRSPINYWRSYGKHWILFFKNRCVYLISFVKNIFSVYIILFVLICWLSAKKSFASSQETQMSLIFCHLWKANRNWRWGRNGNNWTEIIVSYRECRLTLCMM